MSRISLRLAMLCLFVLTIPQTERIPGTNPGSPASVPVSSGPAGLPADPDWLLSAEAEAATDW
ncbi:hypothetical protein [Muricoccus aerilatus]|uniref:hypothetical protein n=1 Tax=Muricoccus aerilatus TaxID=452982 RepID=UPI0005C25110|nr:hypothetical protein [Roseomonas aerilata]